MVLNNSANLILEKLSRDRIAKELIKGNRGVLSGFKKYLKGRLVLKISDNEDFNFHVPSPVFGGSDTVNGVLSIYPKIRVRSFSIKSYTDKKFQGIFLGVDLSDFDAAEDFLKSIYFVDDIDKLKNDMGRGIYSIFDKEALNEVYEELNNSIDPIESRMTVQGFLEQYHVDIKYILDVYPDVLEFFYDALVPNELLLRTGGNNDQVFIQIKSPGYLNTASKFFTGSLAGCSDRFCRRMYEYGAKLLEKDFDGFYLREGDYPFIEDRQFLPWVFIPYEDPDVPNKPRVKDVGVFYYDMAFLRESNNMNRIKSKKGSQNLGFFVGDGIYYGYSSLYPSLNACNMKFKDSSRCYFYWNNSH